MAARTSGFAPSVDAQLKYLLSNSTIKVEQAWSGSKNSGVLDRITLLLPFCLDFIRWDVIFSCGSPTAAPDVVFPAEDADFRPLSLTGDKESQARSMRNVYGDWNWSDPSSLLSFLLGLRERYIAHQKKLIADVDDERVKFEINTILPREGIEMHMNSSTEEVKFSVPLRDINVSKMVKGCPWKEQQKMFLQVIFPIKKSHSFSSAPPLLKFIASPELASLISLEDVKLPPWMDGMCMAEYLPNMEDILEEQIIYAASCIDVRRHFIEALADAFGTPLEADPIFCRRASVFVAHMGFNFLVHFLLSTQFPQKQPVLFFQSSHNINGEGAPRKSHFTDYPWSPRWEINHMVARISEFVADKCVCFKKYCNDTSAAHY